MIKLLTWCSALVIPTLLAMTSVVGIITPAQAARHHVGICLTISKNLPKTAKQTGHSYDPVILDSFKTENSYTVYGTATVYKPNEKRMIGGYITTSRYAYVDFQFPPEYTVIKHMVFPIDIQAYSYILNEQSSLPDATATLVETTAQKCQALIDAQQAKPEIDPTVDPRSRYLQRFRSQPTKP